MIRRIMEKVNNRLKKRSLVAIIMVYLMLGSIFLGVVYFRLPYALYLEYSPNPWQPISSETYPEIGVETIDFVDSYHGWIGGENGLIMSTTDGGKSWEEQQSGINASIKAIDFHNTAIGVAISEKDDILTTHNGGDTWIVLEKVTNPNKSKSITLWDVVTCDEHTAWVLGSTGAFFQVDILNQNWTCISQIPVSPHYIAMLNNSHGWATGIYSTIVKTTDGWQSYEIQDVGVSENFYGIFFLDVHKGWVVGSDNTILATTDGGQHWRTQYTYHPFLAESGSVALLDIFFITELKGWAVGSYGIHYTENGGASWIRLPKTAGPDRITFANSTHGWAVWYRKDRSYFTTNGGAPPISECFLNLGVGSGIFTGTTLLILIVGILRRTQKHRRRKKVLTPDTKRS